MSHKDQDQNKSQTDATRSGLKLVYDAEKPLPKNETNRSGLKNPFVKMMNAYADQIDLEIKAILDL